MRLTGRLSRLSAYNRGPDRTASREKLVKSLRLKLCSRLRQKRVRNPGCAAKRLRSFFV